MKYSGFLILLLLGSLTWHPQQADATQVFVSRDAEGNFVFSDRSSPYSETHTVKPLPTVPAIKFERLPAITEPDMANLLPTPYQLLSILYPRDQDNLPPGITATLEVMVGLRPTLETSDKLVLLDNGKPYYEGRDLTIPAPYLDPGEHQLQLAIRNTNGDLVMRSEIITVYIQRHSILRNSSRNGTK